MSDITEYSIKFDNELRSICEALYIYINQKLNNSECKLFHGSPVWFIDDNPIVGYSKKSNKISLLFWSGQSFTEKGLSVVGKFKAAEINYSYLNEIDYINLENGL